MQESRVRFLETTLATLGFHKALKALDWVMENMCSEKGFSRHDGSHYYYHLVDTTQDLINHGVRDEDIVTACLLHDSIEDVDGVTPFYIMDKFGERVAEMVKLVTKDPDIDYKYNDKAMEIYLFRILGNLGASLIKTADRKHNFGTLRDATFDKKIRQKDETKRIYIPFFKDCRKKYPRYSAYFFSAKTFVEPLIYQIEETQKYYEMTIDKNNK